MLRPILQVEDDPNDVIFLQHAMRKAGVANPIQVATDGRQAIDYLKGAGNFADRETFPLPCMVLLDLKLPYVTGLDVLKWIRQQPGMVLIVILMTASGEDVDIAAAYRLGANAFLIKPSEASELVELAKAMKTFWLTHNTLPQESHAEIALAAKPLPAINLVSHQKSPNNGQANLSTTPRASRATPSARASSRAASS